MGKEVNIANREQNFGASSFAVGRSFQLSGRPQELGSCLRNKLELSSNMDGNLKPTLFPGFYCRLAQPLPQNQIAE
jgi:hypothetical protein